MAEKKASAKKAPARRRAAQNEPALEEPADLAVEGASSAIAVVDPDPDVGGRPDPVTLQVDVVNGIVLGQVVVHYPERDVVIDMPGVDALRLIRHYAAGGWPKLSTRSTTAPSPPAGGWRSIPRARWG